MADSRQPIRANYNFNFEGVGRLPASVAFVSFGHSTSQWCRRELTTSGYVPTDECIFDLRKSLSDPLKGDRVIKGEGAASEKTQLAVLGQPKFVSVVEQMIGQCFEMLGDEDVCAIIVPAGCHSGFHRAEVACEVACSIANAFVNPDGTKVFEAQTFKLAPCTSMKDAKSQLEHAWDWASADPWTGIPVTSSIFGAEGARRSRDASQSIDELAEFTRGTQEWWTSEIVPGLLATSHSPSPIASSPAGSPVQSPHSEAEDTPPQPPDSPPPQPSTSAPRTFEGDIYRLAKRRKGIEEKAPHDMKPAATTIKPTDLKTTFD